MNRLIKLSNFIKEINKIKILYRVNRLIQTAGKEYWHGSTKDFDKFDSKERVMFDNKKSISPIFLSHSKDFATLYAIGRDGMIYNVEIPESLKIFDSQDLIKTKSMYLPPEYETLTDLGKEIYNTQ